MTKRMSPSPTPSTLSFRGFGVAAVCLTLLAGGTGTWPSVALAQPAADTQRAASDTDLLKDFIHFTRIARFDVAKGVGEQLLARQLAPRAFVSLIETSGESDRFDETIARAMRVGSLEPIAAGMYRLFETGRLEAARDPKEIAENISKLTGTVQGRVRASARLRFAGEYAVPQLLAALGDRDQPALRAESQRVLAEIGSQAVVPLATAMLGTEPAMQERLADVLGLIGHRSALPFLGDLRLSTSVTPVREAAERAMRRIDAASVDASVSGLYLSLGERYFQQSRDVTSFPGEEFQLLWSYARATGLTMTGVRTDVYHEAMAMQLAERALQLDSGDTRALSMWLAANLRRELQQPAGYQNPAYASDRRDAMYYAVAAGSGPGQAVLARAIDGRDTLLARRAIDAISRTAGASALTASISAENAAGSAAARQPLVEALTYPNRRVQYDAALALGAAQPAQPFAGSERVVPTLAAAIRDASSRVAGIVTRDNEQYQAIRSVLEKSGYVVLARGGSLAELEGPIAEVPAVDLLVAVDPNPSDVPVMITSVRGTPRTAATPLLVLTTPEAYPDLRRRYDTESGVAIRPLAISSEAIATTAGELVLAASGGPVTPDEASSYAARSLSTLRDLAVARSVALPVEEAVLPLINALGETQGATRLEVAEVLSLIGQQRAQVALMDAADRASGADRIALLAKVASSAKRFGNQLEERQVRRVLELAKGSDAAESAAAVAVAGALNLNNLDLLPLILGGRSQAAR